MRTKLLLKSLLVAAVLLLGGANAWADATSIYERGTTNAWGTDDISATEWVASGSTATIDNGLNISGGNGDNSISKSITTKENSKLYFTATWNTGSSVGNAGNYNFLKFGDVELQAWGQAQKSYIVIGGVSTELAFNKDDVRGNVSWSVSVTIDKATGEVSYDITLPKSGKKTGTGTLASTNFSSISFGFHKGGRTNSNNSTLTAIEITEEEQAVSTANYTIKYLCGETTVKDDVVRSGIVGDEITLTEADKASVITGGMKYAYASDDTKGKTIASDGSTVVTVTFSEVAKYAYTLNAVDESDIFLKELASGEQFEGENATVYINKVFNLDGTWYSNINKKNAGNWVFTEGKTDNVTYQENANISYFFEVEDINKSKSWAATGAYPDRYSMGKAGRLSSGAYAYTDALEGGLYKVTLWGRNQAGSSEAAIGLYVRDAEGNETECDNQFENWGTGAQGAKTVTVEIPDGYGIELKNESTQYNSNLEMDYLILEKIYPMCIVGDFAGSWAIKNGIEMTETSENVWTATVEDFVAEAKNYEYKAVANGETWYGKADGSNQNYDFTSAPGTYTLTFTINLSAETPTVEMTAVKNSTTSTTYTVAGSNNGMFGTAWDATNTTNDMVKNEDGTYSITYTNVALSEDVQYKVVEDHSWDVAYPNNNRVIGISMAGNYDVTIHFNPTTNEVSETMAIYKDITAAGYATFCAPYDLNFEGTGAKAYIAKQNGKTITFQEVTSAPANTGLLLEANAGTYQLPMEVSSANVEGNKLVGVLENTKVDAGSFVLMNENKGIGFYKTKNQFTVGANTAYIPASAVGSAREFIGINEEATGIEAVTKEEMNGELYNLNGQRVANAKKGFYIMRSTDALQQNGKKFIIK